METSNMTLEEEIMALIEARPGITQAEIRQLTGAHRISVSRSLTSIATTGDIQWRREGAGLVKNYYLVGPTDVVARARQIGGHFGILAAQVMT